MIRKRSYGARRGQKRRRTQNTFQRQQRQVRRRRFNPRNAGFLGIENKFLDSELALTTVAGTTWLSLNPTGTGCFDSISVPAVGDNESSRDGRSYAINSIHLKGTFEYIVTETGAAPLDDVICRIILYQDTQTNAAEATATDIMDAGGTKDVHAFRNLQNSTRFKVLMDKTMLLKPNDQNVAANTYATGVTKRRFTFNKNFANPIKVTCVGTTASVGSVSDNNFGIAVCVDKSNSVQLGYQARVRFIG